MPSPSGSDWVSAATAARTADVDSIPRSASRRFRSEGLWTMSAKWIGIELHRAVLGEVRGDRFRYFQEVEGKGEDA